MAVGGGGDVLADQLHQGIAGTDGDDVGQVRVRFLESPDVLFFGIAAPIDLRPDSL